MNQNESFTFMFIINNK